MNSCQNFSFAVAICSVMWAARLGAAPAVAAEGREVAPGVREIGRIANPRLTESSGVVASRQYPGIFWSHTDGGGPKKQQLFAIRSDGSSMGQLFVGGIFITDWEDIAIDDEKHLFIGDLGNNEEKRSELAVHQLDEPNPTGDARVVRPTRSWRLRFPGSPFDCESLFVWKGHGYVVSKVFDDSRAQIFRFPLIETNEPVVLELVATTKIQSPVTGADLSADGERLALVSKSGVFLYRIEGDVARAAKGKPFQVKFRDQHIEGCTFVPEGLLATAESREIYLFTAPAFRGR